MKILIDNGHGIETPGKRSPDGRFREYKFARDMAQEMVRQFKFRGLEAQRIVTEETDISLSERARRVNEWCDKLGEDKVLLLSIHVNAAGNGTEWMQGRGWSAYTSPGKTRADELATCLYEAAHELLGGQRIREDYSDGDPDWEENFYILRKTKCPAVLTENFFMDNRDDLSFLESTVGHEAIVQLHVDGVADFIKKLGL
jgi:N-acetylmuramoyl-L-alanine amidase